MSSTPSTSEIHTNPFTDAILRTEPACKEYLVKKGFHVKPQPFETNSAKKIFYKDGYLICPDLEVHIPNFPLLVYVEVKAHREAVNYDIYHEFPEFRKTINQYIGLTRFKYAQRFGFEQGLDEYRITQYKEFQVKYCSNANPLIIAFNDLELKTWNNNEWLWYGCELEKFANGTQRNKHVHGKSIPQRYLPIAQMQPIEEIINSYFGTKFLPNFLSMQDFTKYMQKQNCFKKHKKEVSS